MKYLALTLSTVLTLATALSLHGKKYDFNCVCRGGECVNGLCGWDYAPDLNCWVWAGRTDGNCPTAGKNGLTECDFCTR
ncbi:hypothetical protein WAI453_003565 [Rhynchosporium graminicola]|uniref:Uncharacterized protein n=1 Tax=Rhynchosporium graminicola TaxID=2792576 RepID=A0A1E1LRU5_9HELO|nr:uncharacterized protein RCO7_01607 [Rhynchosporium commune]